MVNGYSPSFADSSGAPGTSNDTGFSVVSDDGTTDRTFEFFNKQNVDPVPTGLTNYLLEAEVIAVISVLLILSVWIAVEMILIRHVAR